MTDAEKKAELLQAIISLGDNPHFIALKDEIESQWYQSKQRVVYPESNTNLHFTNTGHFQAFDSILSLIENPKDILS